MSGQQDLAGNGAHFSSVLTIETVHETGRNKPLLSQVTTHAPGNDQEQDSRDQPEHEYVLGNGKINAEYLR